MGTWWTTGPGDTKKVAGGDGLLRYDTGTLKSALQKFVRRGMAPQANAVALALDQLGETSSLLRRMPVIVAEDCGWQKGWMVPSMVDLLKVGSVEPGTILKFVTAMCSGPKDKDACGLFDGAFWKLHKDGYVDVPDLEQKLEAAIARGDEVEAALLCVGVHKEKLGVAANPVWKVMIQAATRLPGGEELAAVIDAFKRRAAMGVFDTDRGLIMAACLEGLFHWSDGWAGKDLPAEAPVDEAMRVIPWWCLDMHTPLGKIALSHLSKKLGIDRTKLDAMWFWFGSAPINAHRQPQRHFDDWKASAQIYCGVSQEECLQLWVGKLEKEVQGFVEWLRTERKLS